MLKKYTSILVGVVFTFILLLPVTSVFAVGNLKADLSINAVRDTVLAGKDASYLVNLKLTGVETRYTNSQLKITVPDGYEIDMDPSALEIEGKAPEKVNNELRYDLGTVTSGLNYRVLVNVKTKNGTANGTVIPVSTEFTANEISTPIKDSATTTIVSSLNILTTTQVRSANMLLNKGDITDWSIDTVISKQTAGLEYIKEGSKIQIQTTLPTTLDFVSAGSGGTYNRNTRKVTWSIDAPVLSSQEAATDYLFKNTVSLKTKVVTDAQFIECNINTIATATGLSGSVAKADSSNFITTGANGKPLPGTPAITNAPSYWGPLNGTGQYGTSSATQINEIYNNQIAGFGYVLFAGGSANSPNKNFEKGATVTSTIDPHLNLVQLITPANLDYKPDGSYPNDVKLPSNFYPQYSIWLTVNGQEKLLVDNPPPGTMYTLSDYEDFRGKHISQITYKFSYLAAGTLAYFVSEYFSPDPTFIGTATNSYRLDAYGYDKNGNRQHVTFPVNGGDTYRRSVKIKNMSNDNYPIVDTSIKFLDHTNGLVVPGPNTIYGTFSNLANSPSDLTGPFSNTVLLPKGVTLDQENPGLPDNVSLYKVIDNWNNTGQQVIVLEWKSGLIKPGKELSYQFNININEENVNSGLDLYTYAYPQNNKIQVPSYSETPTIKDSIIETNKDGMNPLVSQTGTRVKSGNSYTLLKDMDLKVEKAVKGDLDQEFSNLAHASLGGTIEYKLELTQRNENQPLQNFMLMEVLPSVGDIGITDLVARGSQFPVYLTGPIVLPELWQEYATVSYSTAANPSRADLLKNTLYPAGATVLSDPTNAEAPNWQTADQVTDWTQIKSFKIEQNPGIVPKKIPDLELIFEARVPTLEEAKQQNLLDSNMTITNENSKIAWNSFAYRENASQIIEPLKVGVQLSAYTGSLYVLKFENGTTQDTNNDGNPDIDDQYHLTKGKALAGAEFDLIDEKGTKVASSTTDQYGQIHFENVRYGKYTLRETKAPVGYELAKQDIPVEISSANNAIAVAYVGDDVQPVLPNTGGPGTSVLILLFSTSMLAGMSCLFLAYHKDHLNKKGSASNEN